VLIGGHQPACGSGPAFAARPRGARDRVDGPAGVLFTASSLAEIQVPTLIYEAEQDRFLVPRFHAEWVVQNMPAAQLHRIPNAWHFAFMDTPSTAVPTDDGDIRSNPPGFDRKALLARLGREIPAFFDKAFPGQ